MFADGCQVLMPSRIFENSRKLSKIFEGHDIPTNTPSKSNLPSADTIPFYLARARSIFSGGFKPPYFPIWRGTLRLATRCDEIGAPAKLACGGAPRLSTLVWHAKTISAADIFFSFNHAYLLSPHHKKSLHPAWMKAN